MSQNNNENKKAKQKPMSFIMMVFITGFFGGVLWSSIGLLAYSFSFTEVHPRVILEPWLVDSWRQGWVGTLLSILLLGVLSIGAAFLYFALLKKWKSIWVGLIYGILLFLVVFLLMNPIFPGIKPFMELSRNTIITNLCLYILYGVFIGFSISYEESEQQNLIKKQNGAVN